MLNGNGVAGPVRCLLIGEYTMGHVAYVDTLAAAALRRSDIVLDIVRLDYGVRLRQQRIPGFSTNWSVRASVRALRRSSGHWAQADVALVHTQTASLLLGPHMRTVPTWISSDATPVNIDEIGPAYGHRVSTPVVERMKRAVLRRSYSAATGVVVWSSWTERSVVQDYGIPAERVQVVRPGAALPARGPERSTFGPVRLLFVGGDFARKGGEHLLTAFRTLAAEAPGQVRLDVVTHADLPAEAGLHVHRGLVPSSPQLRALYETADVAVLPTLGDASPYAVVEAMAHGLPVVTTTVGAVPEAVEDGRTGLLVPADDPEALTSALRTLVTEPALRREFGRCGRERAERDYDGMRNADRVLDLLCATARSTRS